MLRQILSGKLCIRSLVLDRCYQYKQNFLLNLMKECDGFALVSKLSVRYLKLTNTWLLQVENLLEAIPPPDKARFKLAEINVQHCDLITEGQVAEFRRSGLQCKINYEVL